MTGRRSKDLLGCFYLTLTGALRLPFVRRLHPRWNPPQGVRTMTGRKLRGGRLAKAVLLALAALAIGSVFATVQNGQASSKAAPNNTAPPTITGTAQSGSTLTASNGTFSGTT